MIEEHLANPSGVHVSINICMYIYIYIYTLNMIHLYTPVVSIVVSIRSDKTTGTSEMGGLDQGIQASHFDAPNSDPYPLVMTKQLGDFLEGIELVASKRWVSKS